MGDVTTSLNKIAVALHEAGLAGAWRDEQLAVPDQFGHRKGTVERAAVRPLGITTLAVHLVGQSPDGRFWVQQRAFDKSNDPGLWDTLMGGMVSAADTVETALVRETWEEAGLHTAALQAMRYGGQPGDAAAGHRRQRRGLCGGGHRLVCLHRARGHGAGQPGRRGRAVPPDGGRELVARPCSAASSRPKRR